MIDWEKTLKHMKTDGLFWVLTTSITLKLLKVFVFKLEGEFEPMFLVKEVTMWLLALVTYSFGMVNFISKLGKKN